MKRHIHTYRYPLWITALGWLITLEFLGWGLFTLWNIAVYLWTGHFPVEWSGVEGKWAPVLVLLSSLVAFAGSGYTAAMTNDIGVNDKLVVLNLGIIRFSIPWEDVEAVIRWQAPFPFENKGAWVVVLRQGLPPWHFLPSFTLIGRWKQVVVINPHLRDYAVALRRIKQHLQSG